MNKHFLTAVAVLAVVLFLWQYQTPRRFSWDDTYAADSRQPFGCYVMDSIFRATMPCGYETTALSPSQILSDSAQPRALIVTGHWLFSSEHLLRRVSDGWRVILLVDSYNHILNDSLDLEYNWNNSFSYKSVVRGGPEWGRMEWIGDADGYAAPPEGYPVLDEMVRGVLQLKDEKWRPLVVYHGVEEPDSDVVAATYEAGRGELIVVSAPLLFTNYGILNDDMRPVVLRLMNRVKALPVVRHDRTAQEAGRLRNTSTPLIVFLERPPLRLAIYLAMITILLFMFFTAKRRQRVIPVVQPPQNTNLEFVKHIGTLYYHRHDNRSLLQKKLTYTAETVRRLTGIDILTEADAAGRLARQSGQDAAELSQLLARVRRHAGGSGPLSDKDLRLDIVQLNEMTKHL